MAFFSQNAANVSLLFVHLRQTMIRIMTRLSVNINKIATLRNARGGDVPNVVFPCAALQDGERVAVYYGAADTVVGMAFGYIQEIIDFTKRTSII